MIRETLVVAANFTAEPVAESVDFWMRELGVRLDVVFAPYDQIFQQLLDPASVIARNAAGANVVLLKLDRWAHGAGITSALDGAALTRHVAQFVTVLSAAARRDALPYLVLLCPPAPALLADPADAAMLADAEASLASAFVDEPRVAVVTSTTLATLYPVASYYDAETERIGQIPYTDAFYAAAGTLIARRVRAARGTAHKVLALDCDNTLWKGVVGELGPTGVVIDDASRALQEFAVRQHDAGVLLCLCTKNNEADVEELFRVRTDMTLRREHVVAARINWESKSANLLSLAAELQLGVDSFVFLDDSPFEVAEVRADRPEVVAVEVPPDLAGVRALVAHLWAFDRIGVTAEDRRRTQSYQAGRQRAQALQSASSLDDFLRELQLEVEIRAPGDAELARASQMTLRTNQLNTTTIRRTEAEIRQAIAGGALECAIVSVRDRFDDYGIVGLMLYETRERSVRVDTFLLSCRALGRRVEHEMLVELGRVAQGRGKPTVELPFVRTAKNQPALDFLNGLHLTNEPVHGDHTFAVPLDVALQAAAFATSLPVPAPVTDEAAHAAPAEAASVPHETSAALLARIAVELRDVPRILDAMRAARHTETLGARAIVAPHNDLERALVELWRTALHVDEVSITDDFFDLGGDSIVAVSMFARLRKRFGQEVDPTMLLAAPTIAQLAAAIKHAGVTADAAKRRWTAMHALQPGGTRRPLFLAHAGAGTILFYQPLARALGPDQPTYAFQAVGIDGHGEPHTTMEAMAAHYVAEMRSVQPHGPYRLAGFCLGALVTFEMAQQLSRAGEEVEFLGSFDGVAPGYSTALGEQPGEQASPLQRMKKRLLLKLMYRRNRLLRRLADRNAGRIPDLFRHLEGYFHINHLFVKHRYRPVPYAGSMQVFTIEGRYPDQRLGWAKWATGGVDSIGIGGEFTRHRDLMRNPMVVRLAEAIRSRLDAPRAARGGPLPTARERGARVTS